MHDPNLHLFVDDREIHQYANVQRIVNRPRKFPEPVVKPNKPWEHGCRNWAWGNVIQEPDGLLRMYYMIANPWRDPGSIENGNFGYAESRDGIHWEKPPLGIYEFQGSKENNIVFSMGSTGTGPAFELAQRGGGLTAKDRDGSPLGVVNNADGITVLRDDTEPDPQKRYKLIANMQDHRMWAKYQPEDYGGVTDEQIAEARKVFGQYMLTSPDGFHWTQDPARIYADAHGDYMMVMRDERNNRWWMNQRPHSLTGRAVGLNYSENLLDWTEPAEAIFWAGAEAGYGVTWQWHGGITPFNYGNQDLGLLELWPVAGCGANCELVSHRDGEPWQRVAPGATFLDNGPEGAFDRVIAYPLHNAPLRVGDALHIYYSGLGFAPDSGRYGYGAIGLATIGLDRFAGLAHFRGEPSGVVATKPFTVEHDRLQINQESHARGVEVAVKKPDWSDIPGYTWDDCIPIEGDVLRAPARWKTKETLSGLRGQRVTLHFRVHGAILYSYRWEP